MSFSFQWPRFSEQFHTDAIAMLNSALNKGTKPPVIADRIEVVELEMGTQPPELEIRDIGDLTTDQFRGIFRLTYDGDAHIVLRTKVQANPLNHKQPDIHNLTGSRGMLAAKKALVVPMLLRLSHFRLSSYVVLVVSKQKGITLVFKTDPLQNVDINSTFDSIAVIQSFIQREIEGQLRQMFREDLPGIIHRLSQQWVKAKVEAPYLHQQPRPPPPTPAVAARIPLPPSSVGSLPPGRRPRPPASYAGSVASVPTLPPYAYPLRPRTPSSASYAPSRVSSPALRRQISTPVPAPVPDAPESSHPDIENFDPTYGLRPGSLPAKSVFGAFGRLFANPRGLADLAEEPTDEEEGDVDAADGQSYGMVEWEDTLPDYEYDYSRDPSELGPDDLEYETLPAVGGGTITRPRVFHAQSQVHAPDGVTLTPVSRVPPDIPFNYPYTPQSAGMGMGTRMTPAALARLQMPPGAYNPYFPPMGVTPPTFSPGLGLASRDPRIPLGMPSVPPTPPLYHSPPRRARSPAPSTSQTQPSASSSHTHSLPTPPSSERQVRSRAGSSSWYPEPDDEPWPRSPGTDAGPTERKIVLRPGALPRLSTLAHSNHTLSPYTRVPEHFAVRTGAPAKAAAAGTPASTPVRARRKRLHKLGGKGKEKAVEPPAGDPVPLTAEALRRTGSTSPAPPSEMADDLDRYFLRAGELPPSVQAEVDARMAINASPWPPDAYAGLRQRGVHATSIRSGRSGRL